MKDLLERFETHGGLGFALAWALVPGLVLLLAMAGHGQAPDWEKVTLPDGAIFQDPDWDKPNQSFQSPAVRLAADKNGRLYFGNGSKLHVGAGTQWKTLSKPRAAWLMSGQRPLSAGSQGNVIWGEWCSRDGGATWDSVAAASNAYATAVLKDGTGLLGHSYDAIERSGGYAGSWTRVHFGKTFGHIQAFAVSEAGPVFALPSYAQILLSADAGMTWKEWDSPFSDQVSGRRVSAARFQDPLLGTPLILALGRTADQPNALLRLHTFFPTLDTLKGALPDSAITSLWFDQGGNTWLGTRGQGVRVSRDGGKTYLAVNGGLGSLFVEALESTSDGTLYALTREGLYRARPGITGIRTLRPTLAPRSQGRAALHLPGLPASMRGNRPTARLSVLADGRMIILPADHQIQSPR